MDEMYKTFQEKSDKFNYSLLTLTFASLALSFQYSPKMGNQWPWVLIGAWSFFLISAVAGGQRLVKEVSHARLNYLVLRLENFIRERVQNLGNPAFLASLRAGHALDNMTGNALNEAGVRASLREEEGKLSLARGSMESAAKWLSELFQLQFWSLIIAVVLNGAFVAKNFLEAT